MRESAQSDWRQLFDPVWYVAHYPEVISTRMDPLDHYLSIGVAQGFNPHPVFDTSYYLERHPHAKQSGFNPLQDFLIFGAAEQRHPHPLFDTSWYFEQYPDVAAARLNPLLHYLARGLAERREPNPRFNTRRYLDRHPEVAVLGANPLVHYLSNRRRIQVHRGRALGDVLLTTPVLKALRIKYPDDEIVVTTEFPEILYGNPYIDASLRGANYLPGFDETFILEYETRPHEHIVDAYARIAEVSVADRTPEIYLSQEERLAANDLLTKVGLRLGEHFCVMQVTSGWSVRDWFIGRFETVAKALEQEGFRVVVLGLTPDPQIGFGIDLRGKTNVRIAAAVIEKCAAMVTIDSSLMHFGYALRRPVVSLFGCTDPEKRVPDWALSSTFYSDVICRGCHHRQRPVPAILAPLCPWEIVRCMDRLSTGPVITRVLRELERARSPLVSIVIPHYTNYDMLIPCLSSIFRHGATHPFEVVVVADGCPVASARQLQAWRPTVRIVTLQPNRGFSGACNAGARAARGRYVVFLNDDTIVTPRWLDEMLALIENDVHIGIVGPKLVYPQTEEIQHCGTVFNETGLGEHIYRRLPSNFAAANRPRFYRALTGACLLIETDFFLSLGGFDCAYQGTGGCEDTDLCFKVLEQGRMVAYCPQSVVYHYEGVTRGIHDDSHPEDTYNRKILRERWSKYLTPDISDYCLLAEIERAERKSWRCLREVPRDIVLRHDASDPRMTGRYPFRIQIGSAGSAEAGYLKLGEDALNGSNIDIVHDLRRPLPFSDMTVAEVLVQNAVEHLPFDALPALFQELFRVLLPDGRLLIKTPNLRGISQEYVDEANASSRGADVSRGAATSAIRANERLYGNYQNHVTARRSCVDAAAIRALCMEAGFSEVHVDGAYAAEVDLVAVR
jgi:GT2 family glycosyltransferase/ADP-heptose:LPS heptosyltransferase